MQTLEKWIVEVIEGGVSSFHLFGSDYSAAKRCYSSYSTSGRSVGIWNMMQPK